MHPSFRVSRYVLIPMLIWITVLSWRMYPHFRDALRVDGHVISFTDYVEDSCGQRVGTSAEQCYTQAVANGRKLVAQERAKSILMILAPLVFYGFFYVPISLLSSWMKSLSPSLRRRTSHVSHRPEVAPTVDHV